VLKRAYFITVMDGVFLLRRACDKQTRDTFQSSRSTGVRLRAVITLQTQWSEIAGKIRNNLRYRNREYPSTGTVGTLKRLLSK